MRIITIQSPESMFREAMRKHRQFMDGVPLVLPENEMIPDAFIEDIKSRAPHKGKGVSLADGFNPPPLKGRKNKYNR